MNDTKKVWNGIKQIIPCKPKFDKIITKIIDEENEISDSTAIANISNDYFSSIGNNLAAEIATVQTSPLQYLTDCSLSSFFISPVTQLEIENEISKLKIDKATGPFSIPVTALKILKVYISKPFGNYF